jgi:hypothetical protein
MTSQSDEIKQVLDVLDTERRALLEDDYSVTPQKGNSVYDAVELVNSRHRTDQKRMKNVPRRRASTYFSKISGQSDELFVLSAFAGYPRLITTFNITEIVTQGVLNWWEVVDHPSKLRDYCYKYLNNVHSIRK